MSDFFVGTVVGCLGTLLLCAIAFVVWVGIEALAHRRQRRRGRAGW